METCTQIIRDNVLSTHGIRSQVCVLGKRSLSDLEISYCAEYITYSSLIKAIKLELWKG